MSDSVEEKLAKIVGRLDKLDVIACNQEKLMNRLTECESRLESIAKKAKEQREAPAPPAPVKKWRATRWTPLTMPPKPPASPFPSPSPWIYVLRRRWGARRPQRKAIPAMQTSLHQRHHKKKRRPYHFSPPLVLLASSSSSSSSFSPCFTLSTCAHHFHHFYVLWYVILVNRVSSVIIFIIIAVMPNIFIRINILDIELTKAIIEIVKWNNDTKLLRSISKWAWSYQSVFREWSLSSIVGVQSFYHKLLAICHHPSKSQFITSDKFKLLFTTHSVRWSVRPFVRHAKLFLLIYII